MYQVYSATSRISKGDTKILLQAHNGDPVGDSPDSPLCAEVVQLFLSVAERTDAFFVPRCGGRVRGGGENISRHGFFRAVFLSVDDAGAALDLCVGRGNSSASDDFTVESRLCGRFKRRIREEVASGVERATGAPKGGTLCERSDSLPHHLRLFSPEGGDTFVAHGRAVDGDIGIGA